MLRRQLAAVGPARRRPLSIQPYVAPLPADLPSEPLSPVHPLSSPGDARDRLDAEALLEQDEALAAQLAGDAPMAPPALAGAKRPTDPAVLATPEKEKMKQARRSASVGAARHV